MSARDHTGAANRLRLAVDDVLDVMNEGESPHAGAFRLADDDLAILYRAQLILGRVAALHEGLSS